MPAGAASEIARRHRRGHAVGADAAETGKVGHRSLKRRRRHAHRSMIPSAMLLATPCVLLDASSLRNACLIKPSTVSGEMPRIWAVSATVLPRAAQAIT